MVSKDIPFRLDDLRFVNPVDYDMVTIRRCHKQNGEYVTVKEDDPSYDSAEFEEILISPKAGKSRVQELKLLASRISRFENAEAQKP